MTTAQYQLKRAYLFLDLAEWDEALTACELAAEAAKDHYLPPTLKGAILSAQGNFKEAIKLLRSVSLKHREHALPQIYLAEALFLSGSIPQGIRQWEQARLKPDADQHEELLQLLRCAFIEVE